MATTFNLNDEAWDDESTYAEYDDESYSNDDEAFDWNRIKSGALNVTKILTGGPISPISAIQNLRSSIGGIRGVSSNPALTGGIPSQSNLSGLLQTAGGRQVPFKLPETVATKQDINILQEAIHKINGEIKKVADTTTTNGVALTKLSKEVKHVDDLHKTVSKKQNALIANLGSGINKLEKDLKKMKSQEQTNMMLQMFMQPKLESVSFKADSTLSNIKADGTAHAVADSKSTDNTMMMLMMSMMGGDNNSGGSGGGGFGDMASNPLMMIMMMKAMGSGF